MTYAEKNNINVVHDHLDCSSKDFISQVNYSALNQVSFYAEWDGEAVLVYNTVCLWRLKSWKC